MQKIYHFSAARDCLPITFRVMSGQAAQDHCAAAPDPAPHV